MYFAQLFFLSFKFSIFQIYFNTPFTYTFYNNIITYKISEKPMNNKKNDFMPLFFITAASALLTAIIRIVMTILYLDTEYGVYSNESIFPTLSHILTFLLCLAVGVIGFVKSKEYPRPVLKTPTSMTAFASCVSAFLIAATSLLSLYNIVVAGQEADKFTIAKIIVSIPAVIYFLSFLKAELNPSPILAVTSYFPTVWLATVLLEAYFDTSLLITSPAKIFHMLSMLGLMVYMLSESRFIIGMQNGKLFLISGSIAPILAVCANLPSMFLADKLLIGNSDNYLICAAEVAMAVFVLSRTFAFARSPETLPKEPKEVKEAEKK